MNKWPTAVLTLLVHSTKYSTSTSVNACLVSREMDITAFDQLVSSVSAGAPTAIFSLTESVNVPLLVTKLAKVND